MFDILFAKTFFLVGMMLIVTAITARINKEYETTLEAVSTFIGAFLFLFGISFFKEDTPLNIFLVACFAGIVGWSMGPTITHFGKRFKLRKFLKARDIKIKKEKGKTPVHYTENDKGEISIISAEDLKILLEEFEIEIRKGGDPYNKKWQDTIFQAVLGTALAVFATAAVVSFSSIDFGFLGIFLFIALLLLIIVSLLNAFFFKSSKIALIKAYFGVLLFTLYLIYDFNQLEAAMGGEDTSWSKAIEFAVSLYLDIINLFLSILEILAESS